MMNKQDLHEAFAAVHASDALLKEVISVEKDNRKTVNYRKLVRRTVACAAVLALLIAVALFHHAPPYFSVQVYANEMDCVTFSQMGDTIFVPAHDQSNDVSHKDDPSYRPELDSYITDNGGRLWDGAVFWMKLLLDDKTMNYDQMIILVDGQQLDQNSQNGIWGYVSKDAMEGRFVALEVEKMTRVDIMLYDDNGGLLQHYGMKVEPVEGGWNVTLDKNYITSLGAAVLRKFS